MSSNVCNYKLELSNQKKTTHKYSLYTIVIETLYKNYEWYKKGMNSKYKKRCYLFCFFFNY